MATRFVDIRGIKFLDGDATDAMQLLASGAVMVVPSAPGLATIDRDPDYYRALRESDFAIFDSGLLVLLLRLVKGMRVTKLSGLLFLREFLAASHQLPTGALFLVDPSAEDRDINRHFLAAEEIAIEPSDQYVAPMYGSDVSDQKLLERLNRQRPRYVLINLGGGVQEKLAWFLQQNLDYQPGIICTGAAIAFLTGRQANIPSIADKLYLGWLLRCIRSPSRFIPRYLAAFRLIPVLLFHR